MEKDVEKGKTRREERGEEIRRQTKTGKQREKA
jgi:hypothetical protein